MKCNQSRIWTRVAVSNSYDDNHYTAGTSKTDIYIYIYIYILVHEYLWIATYVHFTVDVCMFVSIYLGQWINVYLGLWSSFLFFFLYIYIYIYITHTHTHTYIYLYISSIYFRHWGLFITAHEYFSVDVLFIYVCMHTSNYLSIYLELLSSKQILSACNYRHMYKLVYLMNL